jgi:transglutaminase-like putative cysteine protease
MALVTRRMIFGGDFGAMQTLQHMRRLANEALADPLVIETARGIIEAAGVAGRDQMGKYLALRQWLAEHLSFMPDPVGLELLSTPHYLLQQIQQRQFVSGDCDDAAILGAALGKAVGLPAKYRALSFVNQSRPFQHVYTLLLVQGRWANLDVTRSPAGTPPAPARTLDLGV